MTDYNIRLKPKSKFKVTARIGGIQVPARFEDLENFDYADKNDKYVIMYDAVTQKYKMVNPDEVLSASATEPIQPGIPSDFTDEMDKDLDNRIDLDAGTF